MEGQARACIIRVFQQRNSVVSWLRGFVASWLRGFVASWLRCFAASQCRCFGASVLRCFVAAVRWSVGASVFRCFGVLVFRCFGAAVLWSVGASVFRCFGVLVLRCFGASLLPCFLASLLPCFLASLLPCFLAYASVVLFHSVAYTSVVPSVTVVVVVVVGCGVVVYLFYCIIRTPCQLGLCSCVCSPCLPPKLARTERAVKCQTPQPHYRPSNLVHENTSVGVGASQNSNTIPVVTLEVVKSAVCASIWLCDTTLRVVNGDYNTTIPADARSRWRSTSRSHIIGDKWMKRFCRATTSCNWLMCKNTLIVHSRGELPHDVQKFVHRTRKERNFLLSLSHERWHLTDPSCLLRFVCCKSRRAFQQLPSWTR